MQERHTTIIQRIERMECCFDTVAAAFYASPDTVFEDGPVKELLEELLRYYEGGEWLADYTYDESGALPSDLKRGVLSEDGVYLLLADIEQERISRSGEA